MSKLLIVDDDPMMLRIASFILKKGGHEALTAASGEEALGVIRAEHPAMVFLDVEMPGMSGTEVLAAIRGDAALAETPVCLMSGTVTEALQTQAASLGAAGVIGKPLQADEILRMIQTF